MSIFSMHTDILSTLKLILLQVGRKKFFSRFIKFRPSSSYFRCNIHVKGHFFLRVSFTMPSVLLLTLAPLLKYF